MNQQHSAAWEVPNEFEDQIMTVTSHDGGVTWNNPVHVADMEDGEEETANGSGIYETNLATSTNDGETSSYQTASTAPSDADHCVWFQAHATDCATCSRFIGDYIGLAFDTLGRAHMTWTDMRRDLSIPALSRTGKAEDDEYAQR